MMAMQYSIRLPDDYDAAKIKVRVAERSALFDDLGGLEHKAFLYNPAERVYAPFYVWRDAAAARRFFLEGLFDSVISTFGRPRVRRWIVLNFDHGEFKSKPKLARCEFDKVNSAEGLRDVVSREAGTHRTMLGRPGLFAHAIAIDTDRWELARYSVWRDEGAMPPSTSDCVLRYQVLHISEPLTD
ncbi:MAG TPA: DUF4865 family protein [Candidatus Cybelea sp.]|nr:DUF4865 family protein [Candidatus Cybelea sp.]